MRQQADYHQKDLLVVDSGDLHHGTGLSDATSVDGVDSNPIFEKINYDALAIGNHELMQNSVIEDVYSNFAPKWGKRYLTSNVFITDGLNNKRVPIGNLYNKFRLKYGTRVMSYGFLFNFKGYDSKAFVEQSNVTVTLPWFQKTLEEDVDLYLIVGHVPIRWPEATVVVKTIRAKHPSKPIIFMGGHAHVRDFTNYDGRAVGMASGRYLETIGWLSVDGIHDSTYNRVGKNLTVTRRYLDNNVYTFKAHSHATNKFDTKQGSHITKEITTLRESLDLDDVLGYAPQDYYLSRYPATHPHSVLHLTTEQVLPFAVVKPSRPYPAVVFIHSGALRFDILKGRFTIDDTFTVSPYHYKFISATVPFKIAQRILPSLNNVTAGIPEFITAPIAPPKNTEYTPGYVTYDDYGYGGDDWPHRPIPYFDMPTYGSTSLPKDLQDRDLVEVIWLDFFAAAMDRILKTLDPSNTYTPSSYRDDIDMNLAFRKFAEAKWN
ncbi:hypothetical protein BGX28_003140, partial [Mortierella sp. GBA30]